MDLKEQLIKELNENNEKERLERVEKNSKLKPITLYCSSKDSEVINFKKAFESEGIKYDEKDIHENKWILATINMNSKMVLVTNDEYVVHGRDFSNPKTAINILVNTADPNFIPPSKEIAIRESIKTLQLNLNKGIQTLNRSIQPIVNIMNKLAEEDNE